MEWATSIYQYCVISKLYEIVLIFIPYIYGEFVVVVGHCGIVDNFVYFDRAFDEFGAIRKPILNSKCNFCLPTGCLISHAKFLGFRCGKLCGKLWIDCGKLCGKRGGSGLSTGLSTKLSTEFSTTNAAVIHNSLLGGRRAMCVRQLCATRSAVLAPLLASRATHDRRRS